MIKHVLGNSICQAIILFFFVFYGENVIPEERDPLYHFDMQPGPEDPSLIYPGRPYYANGDDLYRKWKSKYGYSRHMTFIFTLFVFMQIFNMPTSRKIHDEKNIFKGLFTNWIFIGVWVLIVLG